MSHFKASASVMLLLTTAPASYGALPEFTPGQSSVLETSLAEHRLELRKRLDSVAVHLLNASDGTSVAQWNNWSNAWNNWNNWSNW